MSNSIRFACTALPHGKKGVLGKDDQGRYELVVGGLNVFNSAGMFYVYDQARELFEGSSQFMRRVKRGVLKGEVGHPKFQPGMTEEQYVQRILSIYEENVCCIHQEIYLDFDRVKDESGKPVIAIMSRMTPSGPHGAALQKSLETPGENVCFSIRSFTDDFRERGIIKRILRQIVTFDYVTEPGIAFAEKFKAPALEEFYERTISRGVIERSVAQSNRLGVATESSILTADGLFKSMGWEVAKEDRPAWANW